MLHTGWKVCIGKKTEPEVLEGRGGGDPETVLECRMVLQQPWGIHMHACGQHQTADGTGLPMLAPHMHWHRCMNKQHLPVMQGSADPCCMHWHKCLTKHCWAWWNFDIGECIGACAKPILQTLEGIQPLFVVNSVKLRLTARKILDHGQYYICFKCMIRQWNAGI